MDEEDGRCESVLESRMLSVDIHILLVDDDATSLAVVSAMLRLCKYQVVTRRSPIEALDTLRAKKGFFDLVVTDLHMPQMNGLQLQKQVTKEFKLPVIMMSADEKPSVILKSLEEGVSFYMVKPISLDDVKQVWQYAITPKQTRTIIRPELPVDKPSKKETIKLSKSERTKNKRKKAKETRVPQTSIAKRKAKVVWTNSLHNRFLQAIRLIGLDKAVPKKILEFMNVPGLTRENVASHLQKYRIFLKRVAEKGACNSMKIYSDCTLLRSSFASSHFQFQSPLYIPNFQSQHPYLLEEQQLMAPLNYPSPLLGANYISHPNPNLEIENSLTHLENQSLLTLNKPNFPFNGVVSSSTRIDQNFVSIENENPNGGLRLNNNGVSNHVQATHDHNNGGFCGNFEGTNQVLQNKYVEENGVVLVSSKEGNDTIAFGDQIGEHQNCFDVLSEIFMGHNHHNQTSSRREEMVDMELSHMWNGIEMEASSKQDLQPSTLSAQAMHTHSSCKLP
ncbi:putative two-component response regulator ARR21, partial [Cucurbita argyrosperma subsp. sororia]